MPLNQDSLSCDEKDFLKLLGYRIAYLRKVKNITQFELAERSGLSVATIARLESSQLYCVSLVNLYRIGKSLGFSSPMELFDFH